MDMLNDSSSTTEIITAYNYTEYDRSSHVSPHDHTRVSGLGAWRNSCRAYGFLFELQHPSRNNILEISVWVLQYTSEHELALITTPTVSQLVE